MSEFIKYIKSKSKKNKQVPDAEKQQIGSQKYQIMCSQHPVEISGVAQKIEQQKIASISN